MINFKLLIQPRLCTKCRVLLCATCHGLAACRRLVTKANAWILMCLQANEMKTLEKKSKWTDLYNSYINTTELDASNAKEHRTMPTSLQRYSRRMASMCRQGSSNDILASSSRTEWYAHSLLAPQNDNILIAHTHRPTGQPWDWSNTGTQTNLCSAYLALSGFSEKGTRHS